MGRFAVYVVPRSSRPGADGRYNGLPRLRVKAPPVDRAANAEAERALGDLLGARVRLISGASSRRKIFETAMADDPLRNRLREIFG
jgi:uncharacterized protein YggU (UPF0235/DUF167 family)